ncbi:hypothetical protein RN001_006837 [Aquatica leii]|uniref:Uncharacterized protein n=1 Tax=Aquatica leii TaxID=1421715 RepID=A0AAN7QLE7_9COLE|nr:hypothetical protein RN001_006837 [Aquatica leii]
MSNSHVLIDCVKSSTDRSIARNIDNFENVVSWQKQSTMEMKLARTNFTNPLSISNKYDSIVVVLDTKKPPTAYKYPTNKPIYKSNHSSTILSDVSLNISLKQTNDVDLVQDDLIVLSDSVLVKELNYEYKKVMQIRELFNSPNRTIKLEKDENMRKATNVQKFLESTPPLITSQCPLIGDSKLVMTVEESIKSLPVIVDIEQTHQEMLNPECTPNPKRFKLNSDDNCIINSETLPSISMNVESHCNEQACTDAQENILENLTKEPSNKCIPFIFNGINTDTEAYKFKFEVCVKNDASLDTNTSISPIFVPDGSVEPDSLPKLEGLAKPVPSELVDNCAIPLNIDQPVIPPCEDKVVEKVQEKGGASSDFVIFHSLSNQFKPPSNSNADYFLDDEYFERKDKKMASTVSIPKKNGVKRRQESTETPNTHKRPRNDRVVKSPVHKKEVGSKNHMNWELYNFSKPQDCFEAVKTQWGCSYLPNPHEDLTTRFYDSMPTYNTNFSISGNTNNTIECLSVYENQIMEIEREVDSIKYNLDTYGALLNKRLINQNMERWKKLKAMKSRLNDACDDAHRFYTYYRDNRTGWNAWYISEYHTNEIKHQFDILDAYTDFYGYA